MNRRFDTSPFKYFKERILSYFLIDTAYYYSRILLYGYGYRLCGYSEVIFVTLKLVDNL